ncbi:unnamed protein product [Aspergillus oryzae RIB40]|uniref:DNA, SC166 n=1 Tax=Aspergillus oryzae (strain ATCC 42149 / RIB 40) TaxID=510516 RepID=Q2U9V3_ASPOR|nr:unnamed protein product [Aspergillus oryzae RIB40]BAE61662.1 unnamed protein product [Aspergillus oryzae RIB40]
MIPIGKQRLCTMYPQEYTASLSDQLTMSSISDTSTESEYLPEDEEEDEKEIVKTNTNNWLQLENELNENELHRRQYQQKTINIKNRVWSLWCQFCTATNRDTLTLIKEEPPNIKTLCTFFDFILTTRCEYVKSSSTLQTYWNYWVLLRREKVGLSIPAITKDKMVGLSLILLLAGMSGHRPDALLSLKNANVQVALLPTGRERPHMVLEFKPHKTKRYRGMKKKNPTLGIPEVRSEPCLLLCPQSFLLSLLIRKSAFSHLRITSAAQLYALQVPPEAGSLELRPANPECFLFDITPRTLNTWLKRLGELTGFNLSITSYCLRRGAGEAVNSSCEISEAQQNLLLQHAANSSVYQERYAPDYFPKDFSAVWRGSQPQNKVIRMASGQSRSIDLRRPVDLNEAQAAEADAQPKVQRCKARWEQSRLKVQMAYGAMYKGKGKPLYQKAMKRRNAYHTARQAARREMKAVIRARFNEEQPTDDIIRQVHGLPMKSRKAYKTELVPLEQQRAFSLLFRFAPETERDETEYRAAVIDAVSKVGPSRKRRLQEIHSEGPTPGWVTAALQGKPQVQLARRQCLLCMIYGVRGEPFTRDSSFERHIRRIHNKQIQCPDPACQDMLIGHIDIANHMRYIHGA